MAHPQSSFRKIITRGLALMAMLCIYGFSLIGTSAVMLGASSTSAQARGRGGRRFPAAAASAVADSAAVASAAAAGGGEFRGGVAPDLVSASVWASPRPITGGYGYGGYPLWLFQLLRPGLLCGPAARSWTPVRLAASAA